MVIGSHDWTVGITVYMVSSFYVEVKNTSYKYTLLCCRNAYHLTPVTNTHCCAVGMPII